MWSGDKTRPCVVLLSNMSVPWLVNKELYIRLNNCCMTPRAT